MTQRAELATVLDRLAVDGLITEYAVAVDDGDWRAYRALFTSDARVDYRSAGGIEGDVARVTGWLARSAELLAVRQHLVVNRRVRFGVLEQDTGDTARVQADYVSPLRFARTDGTRTGPHPAADTAPDLLCGGRYAFALLRTDDGWRLREVVLHEKWRRTAHGRPDPS